MLLLVLLNAALAVGVALLSVAVRASGSPEVAARPERRERVPSVATVLERALSSDERIAAEAAAVAARNPGSHQAALLSMIALARSANDAARLAALWAVRAVLRVRPSLGALCWDDPSPDVRAIVASLVA